MKKTSSSWSIRKKITSTVVFLWLVGSSVMVAMSYIHTKNALDDTVRTRVSDYASLGALSLPVETHALLRQPSDEGSAAYGSVVRALRAIKDRSSDIAYAYTVRAMTDGSLRFIADAAAGSDEMSHLGDVVEEPTKLLRSSAAGIAGTVMEENFYTDSWGTFLSAYAPLVLTDGSFDGLLCLDISIDRIRAIRAEHAAWLLAILLVNTAIVIAGALIVSHGISKPIRTVSAICNHMVEGETPT